MNIIQSVFYTLLGVSVGSFLNVVIDRLPEGISVLSPPSRCESCDRRLSPTELIPVLSYLFLRGRCRTCHEKISLRSFLVEVITGLVFLLHFLRSGLSWETGLGTLYSSILILVAGIDLEHQKIPNLIIFPAIGLSLLMIPAIHIEITLDDVTGRRGGIWGVIPDRPGRPGGYGDG